MWFLDTGYLIALFSAKDTFHAQALALQARAVQERRRLLTTDAVVFEVGAAFSRVTLRKAGAAIIHTLLSDPNIEVVAATAPQRDAAIELFTQQPVGLMASIARIGPSEDSFCRICRPIAPLWVKKTVKNGPLRSIRSRRSISPTGC